MCLQPSPAPRVMLARIVPFGDGHVRLTKLIAAAFIMLTGVGCVASGTSLASVADIRLKEERIVSAALREYEQGVFHKDPKDETGNAIDPLAPLLIHGLPEGVSVLPDGFSCGFGAVFRGADDTLVVNQEQPTVYTTRGQTRIGEQTYDQVVYVWWYAEFDSPVTALRPVPTGVCITLGQDGFPATWEVLGNASQPRVLFVSASLEQAALRAFGSPLEHRRFAVERSVAETSDVVVARILNDGPVAMGPFVYLDWATASVVGIVCRCMPSQVANLPLSSSYDLQPLETLTHWGITLAELGWRYPDFMDEQHDGRERNQGDQAGSLAPPLRWPPNE